MQIKQKAGHFEIKRLKAFTAATVPHNSRKCCIIAAISLFLLQNADGDRHLTKRTGNEGAAF
ncbi:hypothetical protein ANSO36C_05320 [Nostoc cf. commune SO-36]|uniref:Uncharacterized protein n=1 Tax=Nostoc cf. commune SO-36 TaxID=449208 RepID=A0ABM7YVT0_NOSCO|nr:hypothetical protein [Nostoc commune]BDI14730.1 hypothetical protein ANSO36C_05320 [Nostoc cf. commune SO-36]